MSYFDNYTQRTRSPAVEHRDAIQELVNYAFDNASSYWEGVEEELRFGSLEFIKKDVRITSLVDSKSGQKINDDFRKIIFKDCSYEPHIGSRFRFENNIWISYSTDNIRSATSAVYVRRCNNTINTQDEYNIIHREPCFIDYNVTGVNPDYNTQVDIPGGVLYVRCQDNEYNRNLKVNSRMLFNGVAYKVIEIHRFEQMQTNNPNSTGLITLHVKNDDIAPDDNLELSIANYRASNYTINSVDSITGSVNSTGQITYSIYSDGQLITEPVYFTVSNPSIISIDASGNYTLLSIGTTTASIVLKNNPSIKQDITVTVSAIAEDVYEDIVAPNVNYITLQTVQQYKVYEYKNAAVTNTAFSISCRGVSDNCYILNVINANVFTITNKKQTDDILYVDCKNLRTNEITTLSIKLGGLF